MYKKILNIGVLFIVAVSLCACVGQQGACIATQGDTGDTGKSAYEIWLSNGHEGSEAEFLDWLRGAGGEQGLSAYEIFKKQYAWYEGDEQQWVDDFVSGKLQEEIAFMAKGIYTLQEAYDRGWLTKEDIMHISYFSRRGEVLEIVEGAGDNWMKELSLPPSERQWLKTIDFVPQIETPVLGSLDSKAADFIKNAFYEEYSDFFYYKGAEYAEIENYYGEYNGVYVAEVGIVDTYSGGPSIEITSVAGIVFSFIFYPVTAAFVNKK